MASKPSSKPAWATNGGATTVEPSAGAKATGWTAIKPPFQWMNWLHSLAYQWIDWFDQEVDASKGRLTDLENNDISQDSHLDALDVDVDASKGRLTDLENNDISQDSRLDALEAGVESGTFGVRLYDSVSETVTGTAYYTRNGRRITVYLPKMEGTSNGPFLYVYPLADQSLPSALTMSEFLNRQPIQIQNNSSYEIGTITPPYYFSGTGGTTYFRVHRANDSNFDSSGDKGIGMGIGGVTIHYFNSVA